MTKGKDVATLVVAAGSGRRAGGRLPKQYREVGGKALVAHALDHLAAAGIGRTYAVIGNGQDSCFADAVRGRTIAGLAEGGAMRQQSVRNGLEAIAAEGGAEIVLIHDAARAFLTPAVVDRLLDAVGPLKGAVPVLPIVDSLAHGGKLLGDPVPRDGILRVQTPQAFRFDDILAAHRRWDPGKEATDDAQVARAAGIEIRCVDGDPLLDKITYEDDFTRAEARLAAGLVSRTGLGYDVHAFAEGSGVWLGGVLVPHEKRLKGHSDADVALHAITDAILGALGAGDIGDHFPPTDPQWKGAPSSIFLEHAATLVSSRGGRIDHVDVTVICEAPKVGPHRLAIRQSIAGMLRLSLDQVSVKATTSEGLGFTGRREGIAAQAAATIRTRVE